MRVALLAALAACSFPTKHSGTGDGGPGDTRANDVLTVDFPVGDGPTGPFACLGHPFGTTAPQLITISGTCIAGLNNNPVAGASVSGFLRGGTTALVTVTSDANGNFAAQVPTNGNALDGFIRASAPPSVGYLPTELWPRHPFDADTTVRIQFLSQTDLSQLYSIGAANYDSTQGTVIAQIVDCNGQPVAGATLVLNIGSANTRIEYADSNGLPSTNLMATTANGIVYVFSISGSGIFSASSTQGNFHQYSMNILAGELTEMSIQP